MSNLLRFDCPSVTFKAEKTDEDDSKGIRCSLAAYNGGVMGISGYGDVVVDTDGVKAAAQTPLLSDHDSSLGGVVGYAQVSAREGKLSATGYVVPSTEAAKQIVALARAGFSFQASIGLEPEEKEQIKPDALVSVNGQQIRAGARGLTLVRAGTLKEISILPLGADASTSVSLSAHTQGTETMSTDDSQEIIKAERQRVAAIEAACNSFLANDMTGQVSGLRNKALAGELDLPALNANLLGVLRTSRATNTFAGVPAGMVARGVEGKDVLSAAILIHAGQERAGERGFGANVMQRARDLRMNSLVDIIKAAYIMDGREPPRGTSEMLQASDASTPVSLPGILSNSMHKVLLNAYQMFPSAARMIAKKLTAKDFKQHTELRLTGDITMKPLNTSGEIEHTRLGEQKYTWSVDTFARLIKIDRKLIINDDLSAFSGIPAMFGRGAALAQEDAFWKLVLANTGNFFAAGNSNYLSGATVGTNDSRLNMEGLGRAVAAMLKQVDDVSLPINVVPRFLVVPPELKADADALYRSTTVITGLTGAAGTPTTIPGSNTFFGLAEPAVSPYLSNANYSGNSAASWYLFTAADDVAAFGIGYLNGMEAPIVEHVPNAPENLGWCFRAWTDFGVCQLDYRGAVMSAGA